MSVRKRSSGPKVLGILNLIGGFLGLLSSLFALLMAVLGPSAFSPANANNPLDAASMDAFMVANVSGYHAIQYVGLAISLLLDILLIVSGFGLLHYRPWARRLAILYAVLSLVTKVGMAFYQFLVMVPAMAAFYDQIPPNNPMAAMAPMMKGSLYLGVSFSLVFAVYPIVVLCILLSKTGKAAFEPLPASADDDYEDDYDDRRERFDDRPRRDDDRYGERDDRGRR